MWSVNLHGKVNGAVETCGESFHRFDKYLNFSNPHIARNFDPNACGWAYGMNIFDHKEWKKKDITGIYHTWQNIMLEGLVKRIALDFDVGNIAKLAKASKTPKLLKSELITSQS